MKYQIELLPEALEELNELELVYQDTITNAFEYVEQNGFIGVNVNSLGDKLYEIKAGKTRSIFKYRKGRLIVVGVIFLKKSQKTPKTILKLAQKRLKEI